MDLQKPSVYWEGAGLGSAHSGIGLYGRKLFQSLAKIGQQVYLLQNGPQRGFDGFPQDHLIPVRYSEKLQRGFLQRLVVPSLGQKQVAKRLGTPGILHAHANLNLPWQKESNFKYVLTVHDAIPLVSPHLVQASYYWQFRLFLPRALAHADSIITVSNWTKDVLVDLFPQYQSKIQVIPNGLIFAPQVPNQKDPKESVRVLYVARHEPYKRIELFLDMCKRAPKNWKFVLVTSPSGARLGTERQNEQLRIYSEVSDEQLCELFQQASVYVQPSLFEGFCLPAHQALSFGLPVVYTLGSALDETMPQDRAIGLKPQCRSEDWLGAVEYLLDHAQDQKTTQVSQPTWEQAAQRVFHLYQSLL